MKIRSVVRVALFLFTLMGVVCGLSPSLVVQAATSPSITIVNVSAGDASSATSGKIPETCKSVNSILVDSQSWQEDFLTVRFDSASKSCTIDVNMIAYNKLGTEPKQNAMQVALDGIYNSDISRTAKNKIYNELCALDETTAALVRELSSDVRADFWKAYSFLKPFNGTVGWLLGVISLLMFMLLGLTMVWDIAYITLPIFQSVLNDEAKDKARGVSYEAYHAVKEQHSKAGTEYVSPIVIYMKSKTVQFIAIFICLLYLVSGQLYGLLGDLMDLFNGFLS